MMSRFFLLLFGFLAVARAACAQQADQDVVYLKNGSVIHGIVVEARPDMVRLVNGYGDILVFEMSDIEKIIKDFLRYHLPMRLPQNHLPTPTSWDALPAATVGLLTLM